MNAAMASPEPIDPTVLQVLIVDDKPMLRSVIEEFLSLIGFESPVLAGDGREALEILRAQPFDCMISDIRMPKMPLEELLDPVREKFPRLSVIAASGYSDFDSAFNIIERGAHDFLGKPLNLDSLEVALRWVAQRKPILETADRYFGQRAAPVALETAEEGLDRVERRSAITVDRSRNG